MPITTPPDGRMTDREFEAAENHIIAMMKIHNRHPLSEIQILCLCAEVRQSRAELMKMSHALCDLWDEGTIDHNKDYPCDDTCECKIVPMVNDAYGRTKRPCLQ